jgi:CheY-like chemotaxis protein
MTKVLIAEDNPVNLELLREILAPLQYEIVEASNGQEALAKLADAEPDVVLLDINMPVLDGFAVLHQIRQDPRLKRLLVLAITAYAMKDDRDRVLAAGFDGYLSKPIDAAALLAELRQRLRERSEKTSA